MSPVYGRASEQRDTDAFVPCFTRDAVYHWGPWDDPLPGHDEIRAKTAEKVAEQEEHPLRPRGARDHAATAGASRLPCQVEQRLGTSLNS